ncbi:hypothetical protein OJF2_04140 [Aquisphaera giovannonii]|uniref:Peptidase A2 domain-containing protein n=1 Tax=Aquisphaera giovannonii TaxID=406548 RepID=A0A5B9VVI8_9BACT|nr:hypothetical protein OJF2_04140 [Aquisphaera giovannonii]
MTPGGERYPFIQREPGLGESGLVPLLPLTLAARTSLPITGLLDTGATVNVLPYGIGLQLGAVWDSRSRRSRSAATSLRSKPGAWS